MTIIYKFESRYLHSLYKMIAIFVRHLELNPVLGQMGVGLINNFYLASTRIMVDIIIQNFVSYSHFVTNWQPA